MARYVPEAGDLVWLDFDPQAGREQSGRRPALILTSQVYNQASELCLACPVTSHVKGYPFEVRLSEDQSIEGVILADHIKSLDWKRRKAKLIEKVEDDALLEVRGKIAALMDLTP